MTCSCSGEIEADAAKFTPQPRLQLCHVRDAARSAATIRQKEKGADKAFMSRYSDQGGTIFYLPARKRIYWVSSQWFYARPVIHAPPDQSKKSEVIDTKI